MAYLCDWEHVGSGLVNDEDVIRYRIIIFSVKLCYLFTLRQ